MVIICYFCIMCLKNSPCKTLLNFVITKFPSSNKINGPLFPPSQIFSLITFPQKLFLWSSCYILILVATLPSSLIKLKLWFVGWGWICGFLTCVKGGHHSVWSKKNYASFIEEGYIVHRWHINISNVTKKRIYRHFYIPHKNL